MLFFRIVGRKQVGPLRAKCRPAFVGPLLIRRFERGFARLTVAHSSNIAAIPGNLLESGLDKSTLEALKTIGAGEPTGPKKPILVGAFKPMGYDCRGGSGTFTLRRRTPGNLTVEVEVDVGTWSSNLTATFSPALSRLGRARSCLFQVALFAGPRR